AGFIGSHVAEELVDRGLEARILDLNEPPFEGPVEVFRGSVTERKQVEQALAGCDAVIHFAAVANVDDVIREPGRAESVNFRGTLNVLEAARRTGVKRVI